MKFILFLSLITMLPLVSCQRDKLNSKNLTTANVKRNLPVSPGESGITPDVPEKKTPPATPKATLTLKNETGITAGPEQKKEQTPEKKVVKPNTKSYHIIVASHPREELAEATLARLKTQGYSEAQILFKDNRYRVSIANFPGQKEALGKRQKFASDLGQDDLWVMLY